MADERKSLIEITVTYHPEVIREYLCSANGFRHHLFSFALGLVWIWSGVVLQQAAVVYFPEIPVYTLPVAIVYLTHHRSGPTAFLCAFGAGLLADALQYSRLGITSGILVAITAMATLLAGVVPNYEKSYPWRVVLTNVFATALYVLLKCIVIWFQGGEILHLLPQHFFAGSVVAGFCIAPLFGGFMGVVERLTGARLKTPRTKAEKVQTAPDADDRD